MFVIVVKEERIETKPAKPNGFITFNDLKDLYFVGKFKVMASSDCDWIFGINERKRFFSSHGMC